MTVHVGYQPAKACTDGPTPGALALMSWLIAIYGSRGGKNLGIFNCRTVRGGTTTSLHGEGRALDFGINPHGARYGTELAEQLRANSAELGVQCIIWNRRIWSGSYPQAGWRTYSGVNPHVDHLHVELSWDAARTLTAARVAQVLGGPPPAAPLAAPSGSPTIGRGATGPAVREAQQLLRIPVDGDFGPGTEKAVRAFQAARGLTVDGVIGPRTWAALRKPTPPRKADDMPLSDADRTWLLDNLARRADLGFARDQILAALDVAPFAGNLPQLRSPLGPALAQVRAAVGQLAQAITTSKGGGITADELRAAVHDAIAAGLVNVDVQVRSNTPPAGL
jgi:hypothetical protein